jgi:hypothetical protein
MSLVGDRERLVDEGEDNFQIRGWQRQRQRQGIENVSSNARDIFGTGDWLESMNHLDSMYSRKGAPQFFAEQCESRHSASMRRFTSANVLLPGILPNNPVVLAELKRRRFPIPNQHLSSTGFKKRPYPNGTTHNILIKSSSLAALQALVQNVCFISAVHSSWPIMSTTIELSTSAKK